MDRSREKFRCILPILLVLLVIWMPISPSAGPPPPAGGLPAHACRWIAAPRPAVSPPEIEKALTGASARFFADAGVWGVACGSVGAEAPFSSYAHRDLFAWIIPNLPVHAAHLPDDPGFSYQWNMPQIEAPAGWDITTGSADVVIAVLDTGISVSHPDLAGRLWENADEIAGNGVDDDGNGYADDRWGWNFVSQSPNTDDDHWHGTHVAGIAGAAANNSYGVAGVSWHSPLMAVKFLDSYGEGDFLNMLRAVDYAVQNGARVINLSVEVDGDLSAEHLRLLDDAMAEADSHGTLVVAASGNSGLGKVSYPARHARVLAVGASTAGDERWWRSNYGDGLDLIAPGVNVYSTAVSLYGPGFRTASGTSMAAPHVAGAAALVWSLRPALSRDDVARILLLSAEDVNAEAYPGPDIWTGWGRLNIRRALMGAEQGQILQMRISPREISVMGEPATIAATLRDISGEPAPDGTLLTFTSSRGYVSPSPASTVDGTATTAFYAGEVAGTAVITASVGALQEHTTVEILPSRPVVYMPLVRH